MLHAVLAVFIHQQDKRGGTTMFHAVLAPVFHDLFYKAKPITNNLTKGKGKLTQRKKLKIIKKNKKKMQTQPKKEILKI